MKISGYNISKNAELTDVEREYVDSAVNYYMNNKVFRFRLE